MIYPPHILVIDDDERLCRLLKKFLTENKFIVTTASSADNARKILRMFRFHLVISDIMMPGEDGISFTRWMGQSYHYPILLLTAKGELDDRIKGLEAGADDYLSKPFEPKELLLRIKAILKRSEQLSLSHQKDTIQIGKWRYHNAKKTLISGKKTLLLTSAEAELLNILIQHIGRIVSREFLCEQLNLDETTRALDVQITRLRKKIEENASKPLHLQTIRGKGYILYATH